MISNIRIWKSGWVICLTITCDYRRVLEVHCFTSEDIVLRTANIKRTEIAVKISIHLEFNFLWSWLRRNWHYFDRHLVLACRCIRFSRIAGIRKRLTTFCKGLSHTRVEVPRYYEITFIIVSRICRIEGPRPKSTGKLWSIYEYMLVLEGRCYFMDSDKKLYWRWYGWKIL